ncbi:hypothetical protein GGI12_004922 [Dipsacomyces acuminosporus]|nr:hypothetical protein GGI12_004922 [Dipsacomyces acuminosporus]
MLVLLDSPDHRAVSFDVCDARPLADLYTQAIERFGLEGSAATMRIVGRHGLAAEEALANSQGIPWLSLRGRLCGGKGGFGSMLRSQGNKMASRKPANYDECRDLYGRRLKTLKRAKGIVDRLEAEEKAAEEIAERRKQKIADGLKERPLKKHRFDDTEYTRNCEDIVESTKKATKKALRQKMQQRRDSTESESDKSQVSGSSGSAAPLVPLFDGDLDELSSSSGSGSESESEHRDSGPSGGLKEEGQ